MMPKIIIQLDLTDEDAAHFVGREVVVSIPAMRAEYLAFLEHATRLHDGFAMFGAVLAKMRGLSAQGELSEGLRGTKVPRPVVCCSRCRSARQSRAKAATRQ